MSTPLSQLQALHRELEHRHARSAPLPDTNAKKEVRPAGSACGGYPPLDRRGLRDGYKMFVRSATRLMSDALGFRDAGRCRSAYLVLSLALEELGHAVQLYEAGHSGVQDWEAWWRRYFSHPKELDSTVLEVPRAGKTHERFTLVREGVVCVEFDKDNERFVEPREDEDSDLRELFEKEAAYAQAMLNALPAHAFERWEFEEMVQQSPEIAPSVLYARIEERVSKESTISERDLLTAIARDLDMSLDDFLARFECWKKATHKARVYVDLIQPVQGRFKKEREAGGTR